MDITITPRKLHGSVRAIASKSQAHRLLICAAFADRETVLECPETNQDIEATADCLRSLGAEIARTENTYIVHPIACVAEKAMLYCRESGSTLRFMLPVVGALGVDATFILEGRLPYRPLSPLWEEMERQGCTLTRPSETTLRCTGRLQSGNYRIDGNVSSQFITGLLLAMALIPGNNTLSVIGNLESKPYVDMTQNALQTFGINAKNYCVKASLPFLSPGKISVEGDWSNGAFFLAAKAIGNDVDITNLDPDSAQGDRMITNILSALNQSDVVIDASDIPDLVPILAVTAGAKNGATFTNIRRLRLKESDRVATVCEMLTRLGAKAEATENTLRIYPTQYHSCTVDSCGDHRIAMAAAIAATVADGPVTIIGAQCVSKSYPSFWDEYCRLGGQYEQHIW